MFCKLFTIKIARYGFSVVNFTFIDELYGFAERNFHEIDEFIIIGVLFAFCEAVSQINVNPFVGKTDRRCQFVQQCIFFGTVARFFG